MFNFSHRSRHRLALALFTAISLTVAIVVPADAVHDVGLFQLDRNAQTSVQSSPAAADDWDKVCPPLTTPPGAVPCIGGITAQATTFDIDGVNASIFTGGGSKDDLNTTGWQWKDGSVPPKDDLAHAYAVRYANGYLYFGADRTANNGDSQIGFWFFQGSVGPQAGGTFGPDAHKNGDILVLSDFTNGGTTVTIRVFQWHSPGGAINGTLDLLAGTTTSPADCVGPPALGTGDNFCATVNLVVTPSPWAFSDKGGTPTGYFAPGEFYEGGINLGFLGLQDECFSSFLAETRSSQSVDATLKDFVGGAFGVCNATLSTTPSAGAGGTVTPGTIVTDTATVTGSSATKTPTGSVTFYICAPLPTGTCASGTPVGTAKPLIGSGGTAAATSDGFDTTGMAAGRYCWRATWPGDTNYPVALAHSGTGDGECFYILKGSPTITTVASPTTGTVGTSMTVRDTATFTNTTSVAPTGSVTFTLYSNATCTTAVAGVSGSGTISTTAGVSSATYSTTWSAPATGTYYWIASYAGDSNNNAFTTTCGDANEQIIVTDTSSTATAQNWLPNDSATITSGGGSPLNGTVSFTLYESGNCTGTVLRAAETFTLTNAASGTTVNTTNTTVLVSKNTTVSWNVIFTSSNSFIGGSSHCEKTTLTVVN